MITVEMLARALECGMGYSKGAIDHTDALITVDSYLDVAATLSALNAAMWRPIADAPTDGTPVLIYPLRFVARWDQGAEDWLIMGVPITDDFRIAADWVFHPGAWREVIAADFGLAITHFMPLPPDPPKEKTP